MKLKRICYIIVPIIVVLFIIYANGVYGTAFDDFNPQINISGDAYNVDVANNAVRGVWNTVRLILQILAIAAVVIAGVRYMFSSADAKADIKKQTIFLIVGMILVFGATFVIQFIVKLTSEITMGSSLTINSDGSATRVSDYDGDGINDWDDTKGSGMPDILNPAVMDHKYYEQWVKDHPNDPTYK